MSSAAPRDLGQYVGEGETVIFSWDRGRGRYQVALRDKSYGDLRYYFLGIWVSASIVRRKCRRAALSAEYPAPMKN